MPEITVEVPSVDVEIAVKCARCGEDLDVRAEYVRSMGLHKFKVEPCKTCLDNARAIAYDEGYDDGLSEGE